MEFSKNNVRNHQFLEVDEDLRRIAEREAAKPLCPFGKNCYRKNPNHLQEYRHQSGLRSPNKTNIVKRGKITDFFAQKPSTSKKLAVESTKDDNRLNDIEIEDSEEESREKTGAPKDKDKPNTSLPRKATPKRKNMSPFNTENSIKTNGKRRPKNSHNDSDSDDDNDFRSLANDNNFRSELKPRRLSPKTKKNISPPNVRKLSVIEDIIPNKTSNDTIEATKVNQNLFKRFDEQKDDRTSIALQTNLKMTSKEWNQIIREIFLVEMPKDFFQLWEFCKTVKREKPEDALIDTLGLKLVGPYDVLNGKLNRNNIEDKEQILCHCRYFYDLPEFQTTIASNKSAYHLGYFRDTPEEDNPVIVSNNSDNSCIIEGVADNICAAIYSEIQKQKSKESSNTGLKQIETKLKGFSEVNKIDLKSNSKLKSRKTKINAKTFNNFGFVVPYDKKTEVGYRPLPLTDPDLKRLLNSILKVDSDSRTECKSLTDLQEIIQLISYANDECDFGMGLELGIDLFCFGDHFFHKSALHLLSMAYDLLKRETFGLIIRSHLQNRRKGRHLDSL